MAAASTTLRVIESSDLDAAFRSAVTRWIEKRTNKQVAEILTWEEDTYAGCETCGYGSTQVTIRYKTTDGVTASHFYDDTFAELLNELISTAGEPASG